MRTRVVRIEDQNRSRGSGAALDRRDRAVVVDGDTATGDDVDAGPEFDDGILLLNSPPPVVHARVEMSYAGVLENATGRCGRQRREARAAAACGIVGGIWWR